MTSNITKDAAYDACGRDDFAAMLAPERYNRRSSAFDKIISATHDHFWDPMDKKYIDFAQPFDITTQYLTDPAYNLELATSIGDRLTEAQKVRLVNASVHWSLSSILHGEQGALALSASLVHILKDPGAQEYAANQLREEARHVTAFARYIQVRWGAPIAVGPALGGLLTELVGAEEVWKKLVGMQMLVEGLAMGAFSSFFTHGRDPLLRHLMQLVMTDEAFHHKFGKIWADKTIPHVSEDERNQIEDWAWAVFQKLLFNLSSPEQKKVIYAEFGLDWQEVQAVVMQAMTQTEIRRRLQAATSIFRVLIKTLLKAGIITQRTSGNYAAWVDMAELHAEGDRMVGDEIAEEGIMLLRKINAAQAAAAE